MGTWTQPTLTSDTSNGTVTASNEGNSSHAAYNALDNNSATWWQSNSASLLSGWLNWKLPVVLRIYGITIQVRTGYRPNITVQAYTGSDEKTAIGGSITTTTAGQSVAVSGIPSEGIVTDNLYFACSSTQGYFGIGSITIDADVVDAADIYNPLIFATYTESTTISDTTNADLRRSLKQTDIGNADAVRNPALPDAANADTQKTIQASDAVLADLWRTLHADDPGNTDTVLNRLLDDYGNADTGLTICASDISQTDLVRRLIADDVVNADACRQIAGKTYSDTTNADSHIVIAASDVALADMRRTVQADDIINTDARRILGVEEETIYTDLLRTVQAYDAVNADTIRIPGISDESEADTVRHISHISTALTPASIEIRLQSKMLTDTFTMVVPYDLSLQEAVKGQLLDFPYSFLVYESSGQGLMRTITGMYDVDQLLYTPFYYTTTSGLSAVGHAKLIAAGLGKSLHVSIDDFTPSSNYGGTGATYQNIISGLYGWLDNLPQRLINVFIRGDDLYILQRGHEPNSIDITDTKHTRPNIDRKFIRSVWSGKGSYAAHSITYGPEAFSGTISFGDVSVTYSDGLVTEETSGKETTTYRYSIDGYLSEKITTTSDSTITTTYTYAYTANDKYLAEEKEVTVSTKSSSSSSDDNNDSSNTTTRTTDHVYIGNGFYGTTVYVDGERQGSTIGQGRPGGKASQFLINQSNSNLGGGYPSDGSTLSGAALFDTDFPVTGTATLETLTKAIEWLNRKTEERLSMDIWQYDHVIDFTDQITYNGNVYYLESNVIQRTPKELKQTIQIVRWY